MKSIEIPSTHIGQLSLPAIARELKNNGQRTCIDTVNWLKYSYKPLVSLYLGHTSSHLWCLFNVCEQHVLARNMDTNSNVWEDSCVEIFVADQDGRHYYNFEINCTGTALAARRCSREVFQLLAPEQVQSIVRLGSLPHEPIDEHGPALSWQLAVGLPFSLLGLDTVPPVLWGNFYKCGDGTVQPHYLSWAPIGTPEPNFHQPQFFGKLILV